MVAGTVCPLDGYAWAPSQNYTLCERHADSGWTEAEENLVVTALEGGSDYWLRLDVTGMPRHGSPRSVEVYRALFEGRNFSAYDVEDGHFLGSLSLESVKAVKPLLEDAKVNLHLNEGIRTRLLGVLLGLGDVDYDAGDADCWLQVAVMKEVVYG